MLKPEDNELLVRIGPGTAMGNLFRRFWTPIMVAEEIAEPDGPPVKVDVLGEKLVAFRDSNGRIGLLDAYCTHRRANLFWGRNEECGLRCAYHGWKFDVDGNCVDVPNAPEGGRIKRNMHTKAYPTLEQGGLVWAYLGPPEKMPKPPMAEIFNAPESHRVIRKIVVRGNWAQLAEGDIDSSHVSFLHSDSVSALNNARRSGLQILQDKSPRWFVRQTDYGLMLAAQRDAGPEHYSWRVNQWLMPQATMVAAHADTPILAQVRTPIDDEHTILFRVFAHPTRPLTEEERASTNNGVFFPDLIPGTFFPAENSDNNYRIDRARQKAGSFTGIRSIVAQDLAVTQDQGGIIVDRSRERLTSSDTAIVTWRRRMLDAAKALRDGQEPPEAQRPESYRVRPIEVVLPRGVDIGEGARQEMLGAPLGEAA